MSSDNTREVNETTPLIFSTDSCITETVVESEVHVVGTSWYAAVFIIINAALGAGFLAFPQAYHRTGGIVIALSMQSVMLVFAFLALILLAYSSDLSNAASYQDVMQGLCGRSGKIACALSIALYCFGTCITFLIIIGDQWDRFLLFVTKDKTFCYKWYMNRRFIIAATSTIIILPMCFPKRIDFLKHASIVGVIGTAYVSVMVIVKYFVGPIDPGHINTHPDHWTDVFVVVPTICFGYQCHVSVIPVYACLKDRNLCTFTKTITLALFAVVLCYSTTAVFGYLTFGSKVQSDILVSYATTNDVIVGVVLLAIKVYTTYPILNFCGRLAVETCLLEFLPMSAERICSTEKKRRYAITLIWFITTVVLSITIPNIADVISLLGGFAVIFIFVFPGMCWMKICLSKADTWTPRRYYFNLISASVFIIIGAFIFGITTTQAIKDDLDGANNAPSAVVGPCSS